MDLGAGAGTGKGHLDFGVNGDDLSEIHDDDDAELDLGDIGGLAH